ncbi:MAG TPA: FHA domain-containing protein [Verrucomicrobiae bacterium]|nr:FHA domain-containing protein [Verrucomicrobiae bacterium]
MARLVVLTEGLTGRTYELKVDRTTVGRVEDNAFQIAEPSVSSHHCEILLRGDQVIVKDLDSTNGTFINGQKITESPLQSGQILRLGQVEVRLETGEAKEASKKQDRTLVVPAGVKLNDLESGTKTDAITANPNFKKKSNKVNTIVITVSIILGGIILVFLAIALMQTR